MNEIEKLDNARIDAVEFDIPSGEIETQSFKLSAVHFVLFGFALLCLLFIAFITFAKSIEVSAIKRDLNDPNRYLSQAGIYRCYANLGSRVGAPSAI